MPVPINSVDQTSADEMTIGTGSNSVRLVKKIVDGIPLFVEDTFQTIEIAPAAPATWWQRRKRATTAE